MKKPNQANPNQALSRSPNLPMIRLRGAILQAAVPAGNETSQAAVVATRKPLAALSVLPSRLAPPPPVDANGSNSGRHGIGEIIDEQSREAHWLRVLKQIAVVFAALGLGACASFSVPMSSKELAAESAACARSALCRTFIEDRPPVLAKAVTSARLCEVHARTAETILTREGIETRRYTVRLRPRTQKGFRSEAAQSQLLHTFVAARVDNRWYAVDNGGLPFCNRVCRLSEALHGVDLVASFDQPRVIVEAPVLGSP